MALVGGIDFGSFNTSAYVAWLEEGEFLLTEYRPTREEPLPESPGDWPPVFLGIDAPQGLPRQVLVENVETDVPAGGAPGDEAAVDVVPEREPRATSDGRQLPTQVVAAPAELEKPRRLGSRHARLGDLRHRRSDRRQGHRPGLREASIGIERRPCTQMLRLGERLPDSRRRVPEGAHRVNHLLCTFNGFAMPKPFCGRIKLIVFRGDRSA